MTTTTKLYLAFVVLHFALLFWRVWCARRAMWKTEAGKRGTGEKASATSRSSAPVRLRSFSATAWRSLAARNPKLFL